LLDRLARGDKVGTDLNRRLKPGTVLIREYQGERRTVTVVPDGFVWQGTTYLSLSTIARAIPARPGTGRASSDCVPAEGRTRKANPT
jgi:hypothetical protein